MSVCVSEREASRASDRADDVAARLYAQYRTAIYRYCRAQLRADDEAEDAVQTTFLRALAALDKGVRPVYESAWLYRIARNVCLTRRLSSARRAGVEALQDFQVLQELPAREDEGREDLAGLGSALATMPEKLRRAILMREWQGLSYAEIAEAIGVSHSAVETLIFRARRRLANGLLGATAERPVPVRAAA